MRSMPAVLLLLASPVWAAGSVYLNGVRIDGVTSQKFDKVNVRIDEQGNVHIDAPGYNVRQVEGGPTDHAAAPPRPAGMTRKYFLVTEQNATGMTEYDIDLYVNSKWVRKLRSSDDQIVTDITKNLLPGSNSILFTAKKKLASSAPKSFSKEHFFKVIIGEGQMAGDHVMIENPVVKYERTAADQGDHTQEFTLVTR